MHVYRLAAIFMLLLTPGELSLENMRAHKNVACELATRYTWIFISTGLPSLDEVCGELADGRRTAVAVFSHVANQIRSIFATLILPTTHNFWRNACRMWADVNSNAKNNYRAQISQSAVSAASPDITTDNSYFKLCWCQATVCRIDYVSSYFTGLRSFQIMYTYINYSRMVDCRYMTKSWSTASELARVDRSPDMFRCQIVNARHCTRTERQVISNGDVLSVTRRHSDRQPITLHPSPSSSITDSTLWSATKRAKSSQGAELCSGSSCGERSRERFRISKCRQKSAKGRCNWPCKQNTENAANAKENDIYRSVGCTT